MKNFMAGKLRDLSRDSSLSNLSLILAIILISLVLILPILARIPPHPDEYQFYSNAFSILGGKELQNYLHVALTEYLLAGFFALANLFTRSGVNFPQGSPSGVTLYYGRVFGLLLYLLTYLLGGLIIQGGNRKVKLRTVFFTFFYFSSLGIFERFFRINSDSMMVFVFANYLLFSFWLHKWRAPLYHFFLTNLAFLFLLSFTNLKSLYLALPVFFLNTAAPLLWYDRGEDGQIQVIPVSYRWLMHLTFWLNLAYVLFLAVTGFKSISLFLLILVLNTLNPFLWIEGRNNGREGHQIKIYKFVLYSLGLLTGVVLLWFLLLPRPFDAHKFWYTIKNTIIFGTEFDFDYPVQAGRSGAVYLYDLFVEYLGLSQLTFAMFLGSLAILVRGQVVFRSFFIWIWSKLKPSYWWPYLKDGDLFFLTPLILFLSFLTYYFGISGRMIHWSRWGVPLGFIFIILLSFFLEKIWQVTAVRLKQKRNLVLITVFIFALLAWWPRINLTEDLFANSFPRLDGHSLAYEDVDRFLGEAGIREAEASQSAVWFTGHTNNVGNISLEKLAEPEYQKVKYVLWPAWNIGLLYTPENVDKSTHNQRALIDNYAENVTFRFPSQTSRYTHEVKNFAWKYLGLTYTPELESLIEPQYAVVKLKDFSLPLRVSYTVVFRDMSHYYSPKSAIFNLNNLPENYMFPPCYSNPAVAYINSGSAVEEVKPDPETGSRTAGLYCHAVRFRVAFKGVYLIKIEGLPPDPDKTQKVYSAYGYNWDPINKLITFIAPQTLITVEFGVATKENYLPDLRYRIYYQSSAPQDEAKK